MDNNQSIFTTSENKPLATLFFMIGALHIYGRIRKRKSITPNYALTRAITPKIIVIMVFAIGIIDIMFNYFNKI